MINFYLLAFVLLPLAADAGPDGVSSEYKIHMRQSESVVTPGPISGLAFDCLGGAVLLAAAGPWGAAYKVGSAYSRYYWIVPGLASLCAVGTHARDRIRQSSARRNVTNLYVSAMRSHPVGEAMVDFFRKQEAVDPDDDLSSDEAELVFQQFAADLLDGADFRELMENYFFVLSPEDQQGLELQFELLARYGDAPLSEAGFE